jgi:thiamine biosynthesis lipoprotein
VIYKHNFFAMGCHMQAALESNSPQARRRLAQVPVWFEEWENHLSRFRENSELNQINRMAGFPTQVSEVMWAVLKTAQQAWQQSHGLVTPLLLEALEYAGYRGSFELVRAGVMEKDDIAPPSKVWQFEDIEMDESRHTICLRRGMYLDFGGIAKGWSANEAVKHLQHYGPALVNAGGDIAVSGLQSNGQPWEIGIIDPNDQKKHVVIINVGRSGVATSGRDYRRWQKDGVWQHHIIDPRTLQPAKTDLIAASIIAPDVCQAETAAKIVFLIGKQAGMDWLKSQIHLAGLLIDEDGKVQSSAGFEKYLGGNHVKHNPIGNRS